MWIILWISLIGLGDPPRDRIELRGGTTLEGTIRAQDAVGLDLELPSGEVLFLAAADIAAVHAASVEAPPFIRFQVGETADALQTAWSVYRSPDGKARVALAGAVHIADAGYFQELQSRLDRYDVVLFEGVGNAAEPEVAARAEKRLGFIGQLQLQMGDLLDLTFQKDGIDYSRESFRNADLGWAELQGELDERGQTLVPMEGLLRLAAPLMRWTMSAQAKLWEQSGQKEKASTEMKRSLAGVLANADQFLEQLGMHDPNQRDDVIISVRNDAALRELDVALAEEDTRNIVVFYGAGHLPDLHRRLVERGFRLCGWSWIDAWHLPK